MTSLTPLQWRNYNVTNPGYRYEKLREVDQLNIERAAERSWVGFDEGNDVTTSATMTSLIPLL